MRAKHRSEDVHSSIAAALDGVISRYSGDGLFGDSAPGWETEACLAFDEFDDLVHQLRRRAHSGAKNV
jgi:hypothetical protein